MLFESNFVKNEQLKKPLTSLTGKVALVTLFMVSAIVCTANGQPVHRWAVGLDYHYSNKSMELLNPLKDKLLKDELYQLELTYQWNQSFFGGLYGSYDNFHHNFKSGEKESGRMLGGGLLGGANLKLLDRLYLQPKVGFTIGDGDYTPPVPDAINRHPENKKLERDYLYRGLDLSMGLIFRSMNRLDLSLTLQYTHENWSLQPFEGINNANYPFVSPENRVFNVFRFQVGLNYRFSATVFRKADPTSAKDG